MHVHRLATPEKAQRSAMIEQLNGLQPLQVLLQPVLVRLEAPERLQAPARARARRASAGLGVGPYLLQQHRPARLPVRSLALTVCDENV